MAILLVPHKLLTPPHHAFRERTLLKYILPGKRRRLISRSAANSALSVCGNATLPPANQRTLPRGSRSSLAWSNADSGALRRPSFCCQCAGTCGFDSLVEKAHGVR